jgi:hypothetical protein
LFPQKRNAFTTMKTQVSQFKISPNPAFSTGIPLNSLGTPPAWWLILKMPAGMPACQGKTALTGRHYPEHHQPGDSKMPAGCRRAIRKLPYRNATNLVAPANIPILG